MPRHTFSDTLEGVTKHLLRRGMKLKQILQGVKSNGFDVFLCTIYRVKNNIGKECTVSSRSGQKNKFSDGVIYQLLM